MKINVHVHEKTMIVEECGPATQKLIWLAHVGVARYDSNFGIELGAPTGIKTIKNESLKSNDIIKDVLKDGDEVKVEFK
eukprot:gene12851-7199_t